MTDTQVLDLTRCEIPLLRSVALNIVTNRTSIDHYEVLMDHLNDTARVNWFFQCASFEWTYVSDYMLINYEWKSKDSRDKTLRKVLKDHNYLEQAYLKLGEVKQDTTYYNIIKTMAQRDIRMRAKSHALYALAAYKNPADTAFLLDVLTSESYYLDEAWFTLVKDYPIASYQPILAHYLRTFYRRICDKDLALYDNSVEMYFNAIAGYKNKESAALLTKIFFRSPIVPCTEDTATYRSYLYRAIVKNDCPLYSKMTKIARPYLEEREKLYTGLSVDSISVQADGPVVFRW
ncbi:hypothetical protein D3H65_17295 [Paraflavitalea soli]|uniref:Uncharacterized protein n=1 Tax=Paraflavitalea soli TaxID=2315862 RepID=A0A3B7MQJ6_9BACT|nr:hypothetical protein D3H65_17295 [Paraflavitalea soli]